MHVPAYRKHKASGQAIVTLTDGYGGRRDVLLGKYGSKVSRAEWNRVIDEWEANGRTYRTVINTKDITVSELVAAFWTFAEKHYRHPDGSPTSEISEYKMALRALRYLHGDKPAKAIGPMALKAVRELFVKGYVHPKYGKQEGLARGVVNKRIGRIRRAFRWAVENELITADVHAALCAVRGLECGRTDARETESVKPVPWAIVEETLPHLSETIADMVRLQFFTGMRPGEMVVMRAIDIDTSGKVWIYKPKSHKTAWRGHERTIALGPKAQEIVRRYLRPDVEAFLFSPADVVETWHAEKRQARKTPVQPSQMNRRKRNPKRGPGDRYDVCAYARAIARACERAWPLPSGLSESEAKEWRAEHRWHAHQLRHTKATDLRREFGIDAARVVLGHRSPAITETYAELDMGKAIEVAAKLG